MLPIDFPCQCRNQRFSRLIGHKVAELGNPETWPSLSRATAAHHHMLPNNKADRSVRVNSTGRNRQVSVHAETSGE